MGRYYELSNVSKVVFKVEDFSLENNPDFNDQIKTLLERNQLYTKDMQHI